MAEYEQPDPDAPRADGATSTDGVAGADGGADRDTDGDSDGDLEPKGDIVELTVPAVSGYLSVVRTATAGLAARLSFPLDEIEDLRIAVDEACVMLLSLPAPRPPEPATLTCRFRVREDALEVQVSAQVGKAAVLPAEKSFTWQVLTAHAASVSGAALDGTATIHLLKRRRR